MINQLSDYKFVYGDDLSKIKIDGQILPIRNDPADKTPLRGEDIAFLIEANRDLSAFGTAGMTREQYIAAHPELRHEFTRKLDYSQFYEACVYGPSIPHWVKPDAEFPLKERSFNNPGGLSDAYPSAFFQPSDFSPIERSSKLELAPLKNSFDNLAKMRREQVYPSRTSGTYSYSWTEKTGEEYYDPESHLPHGQVWAHDYQKRDETFALQSGSATLQGSQIISPQKTIACASELKPIVKLDFNYTYTKIIDGSLVEADDYRCYFFLGLPTSPFNVSTIDVAPMFAAVGRTPLHYTGGAGGNEEIWQQIDITLSDVFYIATYDGRCSW